MYSFQNIGIIIPSLNPNQSFIKLVRELIEQGFTNIICVNDGSDDPGLFNEAGELGCHICTHAVNLGKGRALKTAFNYCLNSLPSLKGVLTVDGDGQHTLTSIKDCANALLNNLNENKVIMGCRTFADTNEVKIPFRSKFGNIITKNILSYLCGIKVSDTQTGLRGIPYSILPQFLKIQGERYEYEMNMLIHCKDNNIRFEEVPIETIYEDNNSVSHFNPLKDSLKIYKTIFLYSFTSVLSVIIDYVLFILIYGLAGSIVLATYAARGCSSIFNFVMNRNVVFQSKNHLLSQMVKYFLLVIICGTISAFSVSTLSMYLPIPVVLIKCIIDTLLYFLNFYIQKAHIFRTN